MAIVGKCVERMLQGRSGRRATEQSRSVRRGWTSRFVRQGVGRCQAHTGTHDTWSTPSPATPSLSSLLRCAPTDLVRSFCVVSSSFVRRRRRLVASLLSFRLGVSLLAAPRHDGGDTRTRDQRSRKSMRLEGDTDDMRAANIYTLPPPPVLVVVRHVVSKVRGVFKKRRSVFGMHVQKDSPKQCLQPLNGFLLPGLLTMLTTVRRSRTVLQWRMCRRCM